LGQYCPCAFGSGLRNDSVVDFVMSSELKKQYKSGPEITKIERVGDTDNFTIEKMDLSEFEKDELS
jgi:hypothetical protein